jgi:glycosyltransferase involved in cell wall biosynthesis
MGIEEATIPGGPMPQGKYDVVIFAPTPLGGLAEHVHYQAEALHRAGISVAMLVGPGFLSGRKTSYRTFPILPSHDATKSISGKVARLARIVGRYRIMRDWLRSNPCRVLLLESYGEYFAPLWCRYMRHIRLSGVTIIANLHDPVRDYVLGPLWWHQWSVKLAYRDLSHALCHQYPPAHAGVPPHLALHVVPVGVYNSEPPPITPEEGKEFLSLPTDRRIFLSFGFIRDNKNLDLFIRAMPAAEDTYLLVAGRSQSVSQRAPSDYMRIAEELGVSTRVRFDTDFIPDEKIPYYFAAADVVLLTYDHTFHSQSGVLNIAANYRKPVLASSGESPLRDDVIRFKLGRFISPDDKNELALALAGDFYPSAADWDSYHRYASWESNVRPILELLEPINQ